MRPTPCQQLAQRVARLKAATPTVIGRDPAGHEILVFDDGSIWIGSRFFSSPALRRALAAALSPREVR